MDEALDRARRAEAEVEVLRAALNVALNSNDCYALDGAREALKRVEAEDSSLYMEYIEARRQIEALERENEELQEYKWMYEGLQ